MACSEKTLFASKKRTNSFLLHRWKYLAVLSMYSTVAVSFLLYCTVLCITIIKRQLACGNGSVQCT